MENKEKQVAPEKVFTWQDLKDLCGTLTAGDLAKKVRWWGADRGGIVVYAFGLEEDNVLTDEGYIPASIYNESKEEGDEDVEDMTVLPKGTPIIYVD